MNERQYYRWLGVFGSVRIENIVGWWAVGKWGEKERELEEGGLIKVQSFESDDDHFHFDFSLKSTIKFTEFNI